MAILKGIDRIADRFLVELNSMDDGEPPTRAAKVFTVGKTWRLSPFTSFELQATV